MIRKLGRAQKAMNDMDTDTKTEDKMAEFWRVLDREVKGNVRFQQTKAETMYMQFPLNSQKERWGLGKIIEEWNTLNDRTESLQIDITSSQKARYLYQALPPQLRGPIGMHCDVTDVKSLEEQLQKYYELEWGARDSTEHAERHPREQLNMFIDPQHDVNTT
eukprot:Selendium_serpulae@DN5032_c1_g1_i1.p2